MFVLALLLTVPGLRICLFSTGKRASSGLLLEISDLLNKIPGGRERVAKMNQEQASDTPSFVAFAAFSIEVGLTGYRFACAAFPGRRGCGWREERQERWQGAGGGDHVPPLLLPRWNSQ
jgi:hypothetical protein